MDESNYTKVTRPWYAKRLPFPLNYFVPGRISRQARKQICDGIYSQEEDDFQLENKVWLTGSSSSVYLPLLLNIIDLLNILTILNSIPPNQIEHELIAKLH